VTNNYQQRNFLILGDDSQKNIAISKKMLRSPLGLAEDIITLLFENKVEDLVEKLDDIKGFVAGITSSEKFALDYPLASCYPSFFAYHQYFHSSFRARQGKVLEEIVLAILDDTFKCEIYSGAADRKKLIKSLINFDSKLDMDAVGWREDQHKLALIQLRSRDDTGGTTAKGSLVDYARQMLREKVENEKDVLYIICVWDKTRTMQKPALISKCYSSLKDQIPHISEKKFTDEICNGMIVKGKLKMILTYGSDELLSALCEWFNEPYDTIKKSVSDVINLIENWDDLWIAYLFASMELEQSGLYGKNNIDILSELIEVKKIELDFSNYDNLTASINTATNTLITAWKEDTIRLHSPAHQAYYIRDLLYLWACYEKIKSKRNHYNKNSA